MSAHAQPSTSEDASVFASLIALLARKADAADEWDSSALADDVASISCELPHRAQDSSSFPGTEKLAVAVVAHDSIAISGPKASRTASITMRLTQGERSLLLQRAGEAHLSVSDYLRSCIFEAESLRAQVKEALLQMRAVTEHQCSVSGDREDLPTHRGRFGFLSRWSNPQEAEN